MSRVVNSQNNSANNSTNNSENSEDSSENECEHKTKDKTGDKSEVKKIDVTKEEYPWSNLWLKMNCDEDLLQETNNHAKLINDQKVLIEDQTCVIDELKKKQEQMACVSRSTFTKMEELIINLKHTNQNLQELLNKSLEKEKESALQELEYIVIVQSVLCHKSYKSKSPEQKQKITLQNVLKWLAQRQSVIQYLRQKQILTERTDQFESLLHVEKKQLMALIQNCYI